MGIRSWSISTCEQETAIALPCARAENAMPPNKGMLTRPVQVAASQLIPSVRHHCGDPIVAGESLVMSERGVSIESLSPEERLDLLERLWDSLSREPSAVPFTDSQRRELDRRLNDLDDDVRAGRDLGVPWEDVLREIRTRR